MAVNNNKQLETLLKFEQKKKKNKRLIRYEMLKMIFSRI